jgi:hypothetical protein
MEKRELVREGGQKKKTMEVGGEGSAIEEHEQATA